MFFQMNDGTAQIFREQTGEIAAQSKACEHALNYQILAIGGHRVRRNLPAAHPHAGRNVIKRKVRTRFASESPAAAGEATAAIVDQLERPHLANLLAKPLADLRAAFGDFPVAVFAEADKVVILRDDLAAGAGEIQGNG